MNPLRARARFTYEARRKAGFVLRSRAAIVDSEHVPLFEVDSAGELVPCRRLRGGAELMREIEDLAWADPLEGEPERSLDDLRRDLARSRRE